MPHVGWLHLYVMAPAGIIIPPLPEKNVVQKYQMTAEFIEQRRAALQVYINRVVRTTNMTNQSPALHTWAS